MNAAPGDPKEDVVAAVVNFNTAALTRRCTRSLLDAGVPRVLVLDNASGPEDFRALEAAHEGDGRVRIVRSETNLGFAEGSNRLIDMALQEPRCERVLLLNSDAAADAAGLGKCLRAMRESGHDLMGARMMKAQSGEKTEVVDSLGIALYSSLLASNRKSTSDAYLGPTGGLAVYSRRFLEEVKRLHGYVFDPSYFCYAEDTDLCVRARLLGFSVGYVDDVVAHHEGQASTAGEYNDFILYHGIRNSIWMAVKCIPLSMLLTRLPIVLALHAGILLRHARQGRWRTLGRLYRDAIAGLPRVLRQRHAVQSSRRVGTPEFKSHVDRQFYDTSFLHGAWRDLFRR